MDKRIEEKMNEKKKAGWEIQREDGQERRIRQEKVWSPVYWKGSYTVEAAAILPITLFVLAALILCSFYVHDRVVFQSIACEIVAAGSNCYTEKEQKTVIGDLKKDVKEKRFLGSRHISSNVSSGKKEINASFSASYPMPGMAVQYFSGGVLKIKKGWSGKKEDPAEMIRIIRGAEKILSKSTG